MPVNPDNPELPVACAAPKAPDIDAAGCDVQLNFGPISNALIGTSAPEAVFAAAPTALEINRRLALPLTDVEALRLFTCVMTFGSASTEFEDFNGKKIPKPSVREYPIETKDTSDKNYEFARQTQRGGYTCRVWGISADSQFMYGGLAGIQGSMTLHNELSTDFNGVNSIKGGLSVKGFFDPKRIASPIPAI